MSLRQLRKIRKLQEVRGAGESGKDISILESDEDEPKLPVAKPRASLFSALGDDDADDDGSLIGDEGSTHGDAEDERAAEPGLPTVSSKLTKKKQKKKKKKKGKRTQEDVVTKGPNSGYNEEDEIDQALRELNITQAVRLTASPGKAQPEAACESLVDRVFRINPHHLKAINEMKSLFGREAIEAAQAEEEAEQQAARRRQQRGPAQTQVDLETFLKGEPGQKLPELSMRRNVFIQGKDHWPRATSGGLSMRVVEKAADGSRTEYAFVHDQQYDAQETVFFQCVQMGDPMRLVWLLKRFPYHISTLLQVSSFAKQDQNQALSADLCERALFAFGRVTLTSFRRDLERGRARLEFRRPENRQFWLAGYHYLKGLIRKGTYRTALEWAKLLLSLDPEGDAYGMNHFIHVLATKAQEAKWLENYMDWAHQAGLFTGENCYYRHTLTIGQVQQGDVSGARASLVQRIEVLPWLYCTLFQTLNLDAPPSIWGVEPPGEAHEFMTSLYIHQTKDLWSAPQATSLLKEAAAAAVRGSIAAPDDQIILDLRTARFAYLDGTTGLLHLVPRRYLEATPNYDFDPLPPPESSNIFSTEGARIPWLHARGIGVEGPEPLLELMDAARQRHAPVNVPIPDDDGDGDDDGDMSDSDSGDEEMDEWGEPPIQQHILETLMEIFTFRREGAGSGANAGEGRHGTGEGLPGAWPVDEEDEHEDSDTSMPPLIEHETGQDRE